MNSDLSFFLQHIPGKQSSKGAARRKGIFNTRERVYLWATEKIWFDAFSHVPENMWQPKWQRLQDRHLQLLLNPLHSSSFSASGSVIALWLAAVIQLADKPERWVRIVTFAKRDPSCALSVLRAEKEMIFTTHNTQNPIQSMAEGKLILGRF